MKDARVRPLPLPRVKRWHTLVVLFSSAVLLGARTLDVYWIDHGRTDADHFWGAGLAARHGTLRYIQDIGKIRDPSTWWTSKLFVHDPEAFMAMIRPPGFLVAYDYPPVFALFCAPLTLFTDLLGFAALWWLLSVALYLLAIFAVMKQEKLKFLFAAASLHFPPFLEHLRFGSTVIIVVGLALCAGSFGIALAGWLKIYPWALVLARGSRRGRILLWMVLLGLAGLVATKGDLRPFWAWWPNLRQYQHAAGLASVWTWLRVGVAGLILLVSLVRGWHPALVLAAAQGLSPVWWPGYWCAFVPALGFVVDRSVALWRGESQERVFSWARLRRGAGRSVGQDRA